LYVAHFTAPGVVELRRSTITEEQYQAAVTHVHTVAAGERRQEDARNEAMLRAMTAPM